MKQHKLITAMNAPRTLKNRRKIFRVDPRDFQAAYLADWGMAGKWIASETGYSVGQVYYRLKEVGVKISAYRNGEGRAAKLVLGQYNRLIAAELRRAIEAKFGYRPSE